MYIEGYRELDIETRRKVYQSYYRIINDLDVNEELRNKITGFLFENENESMVLKIYNPQDIQDTRLLYNPIESTKIGKNNKTTIPFKIESIRPITFDVIDENLFSSFCFSSNKYSDTVIQSP